MPKSEGYLKSEFSRVKEGGMEGPDENPYPPNLGGDDSPPKFGGESSKITCFTVFFEGHFPNLGGEIFTPQIWGVWVFRGGGEEGRSDGRVNRA